MRRHVAVTAVVALLVVACNGENRPISPTGNPGVLPPNDGKQPLQGALSDPVGAITADNFRGAIHNIASWNGGNIADRCTDAPVCGFGFSKVPVSIEPAFDAANANFVNVGTNGTILLRLKNLGSRKTGSFGMYHLEPGKTYYVVVSSSTEGKANWEIVPFEETQTEKPSRGRDTGSFNDCHHDPAKKSEAAFYTCRGSEEHGADTLAGSKKAAMADFWMIGAIVHLAEFQFFLDQAPGWVSCAFGCCTLEMS
jgi:hypothetical protein